MYCPSVIQSRLKAISLFIDTIEQMEKVDNEDMKLDKILELKHQLHHNRGNTGQSSSPTKPKSPSKTAERPLPSPGKRVSEHEKQKRIHAWLGDQSTEVLLPKPTPSLPPPSAGKLPAPELPHFTLDDKRTTRGHSQDESDACHNLLASESEFISGDELPTESDSPRKAVRPRVATSPQHKSRMDSASPKKANVPYSAYDSLGMIQQLYDSPIMTSQPHETSERWAYPAHSNFPNDETMTTIVPKLALAERSPPLPQEIDSAQSLTVNPSLSAGGNLVPEELRYYTEDEASLSMSKYEEYEMRPIKPLNTELRLELFGPSSHNNTSSKPRPLPLKKNTGSTSRHSVTKLRTSGKENTPTVTRSSKKQGSVSTKKIVSSPVKRETLSRVSKVSMSPRRKRQQQQQTTTRENSTKASTKRKKTEIPVSRIPVSHDREEIDTHSCRSYTVCRHPTTSSSMEQESTNQLASTFTMPNDMRHVAAATKIQALWRGYMARWKNPKVLEIRQEMRARRSEQYISLLCHELQTMKEKQESERKMRELQTEAIRFMWTQIRQLQQNQSGNTGVGNHDSSDDNQKFADSSKRRSPDQGLVKSRQSRSSSKSPRRNSSVSPPKPSTRTKRATLDGPNSPNKKGRHAFECDSIVSTICDDDTADESAKKKADVSWKDDPDHGVFPSLTLQIDPQTPPENQSDLEKKETRAEDTDEGHGSLTTDMDGTQTDTSALNTKQADENIILKSTVEQLQAQVLQLQEALLSFSDRLINNENNNTDNTKVETSMEEQFSDDSSENLQTTVETVCLVTEGASPKPGIYEGEILSARDSMPKMSLLEILLAVDSALTEKELWSLCEQAVLALNTRKNNPVRYISLETTFLRKDGLVSFSEDSADVTAVDSIYLAPELSEPDTKATIKSSIFGLSVSLWSAADYKMSDDQAPCLSEQFESLLVAMSSDDSAKRADLPDVIKMCEAFHSSANCNSLEVCSSLCAEARDVRHGSKRKINSQMLLHVLQEEEQKVRSSFRSNVVPEINTWSFVLKPASERSLSPKKEIDPTPHEELMRSIQEGKKLRMSPKPKTFSIREIFEHDPEQLRKLNILPGQRKRNIKAMQMALRRQQPRDPTSPPRSGVATAPRALRAEIRDSPSPRGETPENCSVVLRWFPSKIFDKHGVEMDSDKILGYRIYVNGQPKGMVAGSKSRALLDGLRRACEYRIQVRAVSALGESEPSNTVIAYITKSGNGTETPSPKKTEKVLQTDTMLPPPKLTPTKTPTSQKEMKSVAIPKPPLTIGAVFPSNQATLEASRLNPTKTLIPSAEPALSTSGDSWTTATSPGRTGDVSARKVPKAVTSGEDIVERVLRRYGIQKASTLPPLPRQQSTIAPSGGQTEDGDSSATMQADSSSNASGENITPRSKALLDQLKDELLQ
ncbi:uncharacterized protein LOC101242116 isoform X2 [Ciona intestinalis]